MWTGTHQLSTPPAVRLSEQQISQLVTADERHARFSSLRMKLDHHRSTLAASTTEHDVGECSFPNNLGREIILVRLLSQKHVSARKLERSAEVDQDQSLALAVRAPCQRLVVALDQIYVVSHLEYLSLRSAVN